MKHVYAVVAVLIFLLLLFLKHMATDDELNPEAKRWIEHFQQEPDLNRNAYIALMALGDEGEDYYETAKYEYLNNVEESGDKFLSYSEKVKYPVITGMPDMSSGTKYCSMDEQGCFEQLLQNRESIALDIKSLDTELTRLLDISSYTNFDFVSNVYTPEFETISSLFKLVGVQLFYMIYDGETSEAYERLVALIRLERQFLRNSPDAELAISIMVNFEAIYVPVIRQLIASDHDNWEELIIELKPLTSLEVSFSNVIAKPFADFAPYMTMDSFCDGKCSQNYFYKLYLTALYKKNMTLNRLFSVHESQLALAKVDKDKVLNQMVVASDNAEKAIGIIREDITNYPLSLVKNYRNVMGSILLKTAAPKVSNFHEITIELDLRLMILKALIQSKTSPMQEILNSRDYMNPYTGEQPYLEEEKVCYIAYEPICIDMY